MCRCPRRVVRDRDASPAEWPRPPIRQCFDHFDPVSLMNEHTRVGSTPIPFIDVVAQRRRLGHAIDERSGA